MNGDGKLITRITIALSVLAIFFAFFAIFNYGSGDKTDLINAVVDNSFGKTPVYNLLVVSKHASPSDCWMVIEGKVYNLTNFIKIHPGGDSVLTGCGKDATLTFDTRPMGSNTPHSNYARNLLKAFYIGDVK